MITLHTFGPAFGLPDASPFVIKAEVLLKLAGVGYQCRPFDVRRAPKGELPFIDDGGATVADSTLIRLHLERRYGIDFDRGLSAAEKGEAWAWVKLAEDHLYWMLVRERWLDDANFERGPLQFFSPIPAPIRPLITGMVRRTIKRDLHGQGVGRLTLEEMNEIGGRGIDALAARLGDRPCLMRDEPCGADATSLAFVASFLCPLFASTSRTGAESHPNLVAYRDLGMARWYPAS